MKMFNVNTRAIASFVLAIFLMCTSVVLIAWACDSLKRAVEDRERDVQDAQDAVDAIKEKGLLSTMSDSAVRSAVITGTTGALGGLYVGLSTAPATSGISVPAAVGTGYALGVTTGYVGGGIGGVFDYYDELSAAEANLSRYRTKLSDARQALSDCLHPPAKYTFTDPNSGYVYEFTESMYGSDSAAYTAYMKFLDDRGYQ